MGEQPYKRGDIVAVVRYATGLAEHVGKVERVNAGRTFKYAPPTPPTVRVEGWPHPLRLDRVRPAQPGDREEAARYALASKLNWRMGWAEWDSLPLDTLRAIAALLPGGGS